MSQSNASFIHSLSIAVSWQPDVDDLKLQASALAEKLNLPITTATSNAYHLLLVYTSTRLELHQCIPTRIAPVYADFNSAKIQYRIQHGGGIRQLLAKAVGIKSGLRPTICDATAGLGRDSFILAALGCQVTMIERSVVIASLLENALSRAESRPQTREIVKHFLKLIVGDSISVINELQKKRQIDTIYIDPMYPPRTKSALVKKEMRVIKSVAGKDEDAPLLLETALNNAGRRVVVKRPKLAAALAGPSPSSCLRGKNSRYDIYFV